MQSPRGEEKHLLLEGPRVWAAGQRASEGQQEGWAGPEAPDLPAVVSMSTLISRGTGSQ